MELSLFNNGKIKRTLFIILFLFTSLFQSSAQHWQGILGYTDGWAGVMYQDTVTDLLYIGGSFTRIDGNFNMRGIIAYDGTTFNSLGIGIDNDSTGDPGSVWAICRYNNELYVGGGFHKVGNVSSKSIAKWDGTNWHAIIANNVVTDIKVFNNEMYVSGDFDTIAGIAARYVAKYDGTIWTALNCHWQYYTISTLCYFNNEVYATGNMSDTLGNELSVMKYTSSGWVPIIGFPGSLAGAFTSAIYQNKFYMGGFIFGGPNNPGTGILTYDGIQFHDVGGGVGGGTECIYAMGNFNNNLYALGNFFTAGGVPALNIAKWDGTNWCGLGSNFDNTLLALGSYHNELYISGGFNVIDGDSIRYFAKWIGGNYTDTCGNTTGIKEISNDKVISVYPNPATQTLHLQIRTKLKYISIKDITGREVMFIANPDNTIDVSLLSKGLYFIQGFDGERMVEAKFVKE